MKLDRSQKKTRRNKMLDSYLRENPELVEKLKTSTLECMLNILKSDAGVSDYDIERLEREMLSCTKRGRSVENDLVKVISTVIGETVPLKYELIKDKPIVHTKENGEEVTLYRIRAIESFTITPKFDYVPEYGTGSIRIVKGDIGGMVEGEHNLCNHSLAWIHFDSAVTGRIRVEGNSYIAKGSIVDGDTNYRVTDYEIYNCDIFVESDLINGGCQHHTGKLKLNTPGVNCWY